MTVHARVRRRLVAAAVVLWCLAGLQPTVHSWGAQGHRLVGRIAANHLTPAARRHVAWLLGRQTLADVSLWADQYRDSNYQTSYWHFLNIPPTATSYDRDRDCPRQPTVSAGASADRWRDCAVERIEYNQVRVANPSLDRADRAVALKFLVHLVGDLHQPFHALGVERGGNGISVSVFGSENCSTDPSRPFPCNLHSVWDSALIEYRQLDDRRYLAVLEDAIRRNRWDALPTGSPADWAIQSHGFGKAALLPPNGNVDETYYRRSLPVVEERLALAGLRLAALLNRALTAAPPVD